MTATRLGPPTWLAGPALDSRFGVGFLELTSTVSPEARTAPTGGRLDTLAVVALG
jgi:hypothetical protein